MAEILVRYEIKEGTAAFWASVNPVLRSGEPGWERDTKVLRIGDGVTPFTSLKRFASIEDIDSSVLLTKTGNLAGMSDVVAARANLGVDAAADGTGRISFYARTTAPPGEVKANGGAYSRTVYSRLFGVIGTTFGAGDGSTTFNVPDLRGEFLRGWDDGRGVDTGRALGSAQGQMFQDHTHNGVTDNHGGHSHGINDPGHTHNLGDSFGLSDNAGSGLGFTSGIEQRANTISSSQTGITIQATGGHTHNVSGYGVNAGSWTAGSETRPRNVALLACIKF
jgi:phage-related tail fiber protein